MRGRKKKSKVTPVNLETVEVQKEKLEALERQDAIKEDVMISENSGDVEKDQVKKVGDFGKHQKKFIWVILLGALCIVLGAFTYYFHFDKKAMFVRATTQLEDRIEYLYQPLLEHAPESRKSYTVTGKANLTIQSDLFTMMDPTYEMYQTLIANLNKMEHQYTYQVDKEKEEMV